MDVFKQLGGPAAVARMAAVKPSSVTEWRRRGIPPDRCTVLERLSGGVVHCEQMRPDLAWVRVADEGWPWHPAGKPLLDVASAGGAQGRESRNAAEVVTHG